MKNLIGLVFIATFAITAAAAWKTERKTDEMTDAELLSQTFMFGWAGAEPPELLYQWVER